jgi:hypothetical protein
MDVKFRPLLTVVVVTAIATGVAQVLPPSRELRPVALLLDLLPFGGVVLATVITTLRLRRAPLIRLLLTAYGYFAGALIGALGVAHLVAVLGASLDRAGRHQFVYSFRFYSLVLLGVLLIVTGLMAATQAAHLARGHRATWRASLSVWTVILAINLPLVPLQGFAVGFSVLAVLELLFLGGMRRHFGVQSAARVHSDIAPEGVIGCRSNCS